MPVNLRSRNEEIPAVFDELWAAVIEPDRRGRLKWSPIHQDWLPWLDGPAGYPGDFAREPLGQPLRDDFAVRVPVLVAKAADAVHQRFGKSSCCGLCGGGVADHYVMPNIFGDAQVYCVQLPDEAMAPGSTVKHWASLEACRHVTPRFVSDQHGDEWIEFIHGRGVPASSAVSQPWCLDCRTAAERVTADAKEEGLTSEVWLRNNEQELLDRRRQSRRYR
ncbi:hypothetical protein [Nocardia nepalensis]|uniref:hypothetical protein n=1 Tax=Nocardia nepalensis TaxID=3375448 RepID=UPI003B66D667